MNEERFVIISTDEFEGRIYDRFDDEFLNLEQILDLLNDYEKNILILTMMELPEMENMLIKQSSIIRKDEIAIETMMSNMEKLEKENEQLKQEHKIAIDEMITDYKKLEKENERLNNDFHFLKEIHQEGSKSCEKWKQYKEAQIQQLEKENKQLRTELDSFRPILFHDMRIGTITLYSKGGIDE